MHFPRPQGIPTPGQAWGSGGPGQVLDVAGCTFRLVPLARFGGPGAYTKPERRAKGGAT